MNKQTIRNRMLTLGIEPWRISFGWEPLEGEVVGPTVSIDNTLHGLLPLDDESDIRFADYMVSLAKKAELDRAMKA